MKLDKRIIKGKRPLTCFDIEEAEKYIGKMCYISDNYDFFCDMDLTQQKILNGVEDCEVPFHFDSDNQAEFCLPCEWVTEEKKYRPYTIEEFCNEGFEIVVFRNKNDESIERHVRYNGYIKYDNEVYLIVFGNKTYPLNELFDDYEYLDDDGVWKPFGVEGWSSF